MESKQEKKPMPKWLIYTLFILKFVLGLALIWWTVYMTFQSDVGKDDDNAFLSDYHHIDDNYNKLMEQNNEFNSKYNVKFVFNDEVILGLTHQDVYLSQRVIQERKIRKDIINVGANKFSVYIQDKAGNIVTTNNIEILVTKNTTHTEDVKLHFVNEDTKTFTIKSKGYWNITGTVETNGSKGYFYIKTNGKKHTK
ncbi:hypothetical protein OAR97_07775 [Arcobacteraceae bacterium]|nr:hypothetical protein [Arcobacteraceae bacterium]